MNDYYEILRVSPTADRQAIEAAYRRLSAASADDPAATAKLDEAYAVLTDPERRKRYDRERMAARTRRPSSASRRKKSSSALSGKRLAFTAIGALVGIAAVGGILVMAMGGGDDGDATADTTPTASFDEFGPPPVVGDNILAISPEHGARIPQEQTLSPNPEQPDNGVCINATFLVEPGITAQWFHIFFDGELVTPETAWIITSNPDEEQPEGGVLCYAPAEGFELGMHDVQAIVQDPQASQPRQVVRWSFEVVR